MQIHTIHGKGVAVLWMSIQSYQFIEEVKSKSSGNFDPFNIMGMSLGEPKPTGKLLFLIEAKVTEHQVGISNNANDRFVVKWELKRQEKINGNEYMIFSGWGDPMNGGHVQFESKEIGLEKKTFIDIFRMQINDDPEYFSKEKLNKTKGLENISL